MKTEIITDNQSETITGRCDEDDTEDKTIVENMQSYWMHLADGAEK